MAGKLLSRRRQDRAAAVSSVAAYVHAAAEFPRAAGVWKAAIRTRAGRLNAIQENSRNATPTRSQRDDLLKTAADRLHPSLTNPNFLVFSSRRKIFQRWIADFEDKKLRILDIGG